MGSIAVNLAKEWLNRAIALEIEPTIRLKEEVSLELQENFLGKENFSRRIQAYKKRLATSKTGKVAKKARKFYRVGSKPLQAIIKNPFSLKAYLIAFGLLLFLAILGIGSSGITRQDEFDMNDTWLYLSKLDREKSNDKVDYWTKIDDPLLYLNYKYDDISR